MNKKIVTVTLLVLIAFVGAFAPLEVLAQSPNIGVYIGQITPSSATGSVGTGVNILGSIYSPNGTYQLVLGKTVVTTGKSEGYYVNANFTVPELPSGVYALILRDVAININYSSQFTVITGYSINAVPSSLQEGDNLKLNVAITGGKPITSYSAEISVVLPGSVGTKYSKIVALGLPNTKGTANAEVTFPDSSFLPSGSLTDYAGTYTVYFNQSASLAQNQFSVNFIDSTTYHRGQTVTIRATDYQPNQAATLTVSKGSSTLGTTAVTASADGIIRTTYIVSSDAAVGEYTIEIAPQGTPKLIQDSQTFTVPGYPVKVQTTNLAGEAVSGIAVQATDETTNNIYNSTSGSDGIANLKLEKGDIFLVAFWNGVNVGETNVTVSGEGTLGLRCQLTDLKIIVRNTNGIAMPFVNLNIAYQYRSTSGSKTGSASGQTDPSGSFTLSSTFTGASYTIDASMYNQIFNSGNKIFSNLPTQPTVEVVIICPSENITMNVVGYNQEPIAGARIELVELSNGLFYSATTDSNGAVESQVTLGMYRARIYKDNILIDETNLQAFNQSQQQIRCTLYGIQVSVSVVDFFSRPIPNADVTLNGPEAEKLSQVTQGDGIATFGNVIGGGMQIVAQAPGAPDSYQALTLNIDQPTTVQIRLDKYIALGSLLIQSSSLITIIIILVTIVLFALVEVYRRRRTDHVTAT